MQQTHSTPELDCLDFSGKTVYNDFRDDLVRDGYAVIPAIGREKAYYYADQIHEWLESFGLGYKRDDPSTIREECLPIIHQKGLMQAYGITHESFTWGVRQEPAVVGAFEKIFGTEDLLVSFDAVNVSLPRKDLPKNKPWAHQDQDPENGGFRCMQGFVNLYPCGDNDGGLMVLVGGHNVSKEYHDHFRAFGEDRGFRWTNEMYAFQEHGLKWLEERGYKWKKVNANPGDLVLWDSRTPHYNVSPDGTNPRFVVYTSYAPVFTADQADLLRKKECFENLDGHSHWPQCLQPFIKQFVTPMRDGKPDPLNTWNPREKPVLTERGFKLTGIPYIKNTA